MGDRRARDLGIRIGYGRPGPLNAITDVAGVRVGHRSVIRGEDGDRHAVRTGVTALFPHSGDPWAAPVYAATHILNGYGELIGINSIREWGVLESPVVLTSSLQIGRAYDATVKWIAGRSRGGGEAVMPCVTECDDSWLSDVLSFPLSDDDVFAALDTAADGPVQEGCVGGGVGMQCFDFKGGIGTASRIVDDALGGFTVAALVMTNHGVRRQLLIDGVRIGEALAEELMPAEHNPAEHNPAEHNPAEHHEGSCIVVVATDAPLLPHQLRRVAERAGLGLARGGSSAGNSSGEQFLAFSSATRLPTRGSTFEPGAVIDGAFAGGGDVLSAIFRATVEATEEAVLNALLAAETTSGRDGRTYFALPVDRTLELLERYGRTSR